MQLVNSLESILGQVSKIRVLRFLANTGMEFNGQEIASAVGLSHVQVHAVLKELNRRDVVGMRRVGKAILYRLNPKNELVRKIIIPLFEKEAGLKNMLSDTLIKYLKRPAPKSVILFGSFASGEARPDSDIDVLIVASRKEDVGALDESLKRAEVGITAGFGNRLAPIVMHEAEFKKRFKRKDKFVLNIARQGSVIFGKTINEIISSDD